MWNKIEFQNAGLSDIAKEHEYGKIFEKTDLINNGNNQHPIGFGVGMTASYTKKSNNSASIEFDKQLIMTKEEIQEEINNFMNYIDDISLQMTFSLKKINQYKNLFEYAPNTDINIVCRCDNTRIDEKTFERIKPIINSHERYLRDNLAVKEEVRKNNVTLGLVSLLVPLLTGIIDFFFNLKKKSTANQL